MAQDRYARQISLKQIGRKGQERIRRSRAVVVGCGALGSSSADLLARAGVGELVLVDRDVVDLVNLHRQRYYEGDVGRPKAEALSDHIQKVNSSVKVTPLSVEFGPKNAVKIARRGDIILDGCDNMETRFVINDAAFKLGIPWVYGGAVGVEGMCALFASPKPCFRCLFRRPPRPGSLDTCAEVGIINTLPATIAAMQVTMAVRWLLGDGGTGELASFDIWDRAVQKVSFRQRKGCECCAKRRYEFLRSER